MSEFVLVAVGIGGKVLPMECHVMSCCVMAVHVLFETSIDDTFDSCVPCTLLVTDAHVVVSMAHESTVGTVLHEVVLSVLGILGLCKKMCDTVSFHCSKTDMWFDHFTGVYVFGRDPI